MAVSVFVEATRNSGLAASQTLGSSTPQSHPTKQSLSSTYFTEEAERGEVGFAPRNATARAASGRPSPAPPCCVGCKASVLQISTRSPQTPGLSWIPQLEVTGVGANANFLALGQRPSRCREPHRALGIEPNVMLAWIMLHINSLYISEFQKKVCFNLNLDIFKINCFKKGNVARFVSADKSIQVCIHVSGGCVLSW